MRQRKQKTLSNGPMHLPRNRTNWYKLYRDIVANWEDLRGLRNRKRIWAHLEEIVSSIRRYRVSQYGDTFDPFDGNFDTLSVR